MARMRRNVRRVLSVCQGCGRLQKSGVTLGWMRCGRVSQRYFGYRSAAGFETERVPARCDRMTEHATVRALRSL